MIKMEGTRVRLSIGNAKVDTVCLEYSLCLLQHLSHFDKAVIAAKQSIHCGFINNYVKCARLKLAHIGDVHD